MHRFPRVLLTPVLLAGAATVSVPQLLAASGPVVGASIQSARPKAAADAPNVPPRDPEFQTEQQLLVLANQSRQQHGAPALTLDAGLSRAALIHAQAMLEARQL